MVTPKIFDGDLRRRRLARAIAWGNKNAAPAADFLLRAAVEEMAARLSVVQRDFLRALDLGAATPLLAQTLARPDRFVLRLAPAVLAQPEPNRATAHAGLAVADEECLPIAAQSVDLIVSALALQWTDDLPGALVQIRRALRPDGLFLACLIGGESLTELRQSFTLAEIENEGGASPRVAPFVDLRALGGLLQRAGFALPVVDSEKLTVRYDHMFGLTADLRAMAATNNLVARSRKPLRRQTVARAAQIYAERFADADGRLRATFEFVWISGWAAHESQQKPLKPGSAERRLADALKTREFGPDDF